MKWFVISAAGLLLLPGCHTVNFQATNADNKPLVISVNENDSDGKVQQTISLGQVDAGQSASKTFEVGNGHDVSCNATLIQGFTCFKGAKQTVISSDPDPLSIKVAVKQNLGGALPDDQTAIDELAQAATDFSPVYDGVKIAAVDGAVQRYWGALLVVIPPTTDPSTQALTNGQIIDDIPASVFSSVLTIADDQYPPFNHSSSSDMSGSALVKFSGKYPAFGSADANWSSSNVYQVKWTLNGCGWKTRPDSNGFNQFEQIGKLPDATKKQLLKDLNGNPHAKLMYVTDVYVVRDVERTVTKGTTISAGGDLNVGSIVTVNGAYDFKESSNDTESIGARMVNVGGIPFTPAFISLDDGSPVALDKMKEADFLANKIALVPSDYWIPPHNSGKLTVPLTPDLPKLRQALQHER